MINLEVNLRGDPIVMYHVTTTIIVNFAGMHCNNFTVCGFRSYIYSSCNTKC